MDTLKDNLAVTFLPFFPWNSSAMHIWIVAVKQRSHFLLNELKQFPMKQRNIKIDIADILKDNSTVKFFLFIHKIVPLCRYE